MKRMRVGLLVSLLPCLLVAAPDPTAPADPDGFVVLCPIDGMVDDGMAVIVERAVMEAAGAEAIIFLVDTPGGRVDSAVKVSNLIVNARPHTIAYIRGMGAVSAGALISFSCQDIIMSPEATIGAAAPVVLTPQGALPTGEKEVSFMRTKMRALAERNGYNPDIAEAMVDKDIELRAFEGVDGELIVYASSRGGESEAEPASEPSGDPSTESLEEAVEKLIETLTEDLPVPTDDLKETAKKLVRGEGDAPEEVEALPEEEEVNVPPGRLILASGKLLTLSAQQALDYQIIETTADNLDEAIAYYGYYGLERVEIEPTWAEGLFRWLTHPMVSGILLMLGLGGLYFEVRTPGFGLPGIIGLTCLALFFGARAVLGIADWIDLLLVIIGLILILLEVVALPGFGIAGIAGIVCLLAGFYLALTNVTFPQYSWDFDRLRDAGYLLFITMITLTVFVVATWKLLPHTPAYGWLVLSTAQEANKGYVVQTEAQEEAAIGQVGTAVTMLRPAGRGRFGSTTYSVVSRAEFIDAGTPIVIIEAEGNRYVVDKAKEEA